MSAARRVRRRHGSRQSRAGVHIKPYEETQMNRIILAILASTAVLLFTPVDSYAQNTVARPSTKNPGYLVDRNGDIVKSARTGQCIRLARQWSASVADRQCAATLAQQASAR